LNHLLFLILSGVVFDPNHQPVAHASVAVENAQKVVTAADGRFRFDLPRGVYTLHVLEAGFQPQTVTVSAGEEVAITLRPLLAENIVVSGIRADAETPVTKSDLGRADIERDYFGQDIPMMLRDTPSISAYAEGGVGGAGYSYIAMRGISSSRINFTLDGVPLADSEDMSAYFVDFPDLAQSLDSIQAERGAGTSRFGAGGFGGSINLASVAA